MAVVIDASIALSWCFPDERTDFTEAVFNAVGSSTLVARVPTIWAYEVRNAVLMGLRRNRITKPESKRFLYALGRMGVVIAEPSDYDSVFTLADQHGLTFYDAAYLNLALTSGLPIASLDKRVLRAAAGAGVPLFRP
ncbi:MAG TPA: type II toxin-antitoxin system VapC family toxin [Bryobacteraceae bacterium]|nr:type II toxin-antitoxin system VapC family toxin [Bryobacteraceae bacterium]